MRVPAYPDYYFHLHVSKIPAAVAAIEETLVTESPYAKKLIQAFRESADVITKLSVYFDLGDIECPLLASDMSITFLRLRKQDAFSGKTRLRILTLRAIAPFVTNGSYISFHNDAMQRYVFQDGKLYRQDAIVTWPEVSDDQDMTHDR